MSEFEYVLLCLLIPIVYVMTYIAGKHDFLALVCKMLEEKAEKYKAKENEHEKIEA